MNNRGPSGATIARTRGRTKDDGQSSELRCVLGEKKDAIVVEGAFVA